MIVMIVMIVMMSGFGTKPCTKLFSDAPCARHAHAPRGQGLRVCPARTAHLPATMGHGMALACPLGTCAITTILGIMMVMMVMLIRRQMKQITTLEFSMIVVGVVETDSWPKPGNLKCMLAAMIIVSKAVQGIRTTLPTLTKLQEPGKQSAANQRWQQHGSPHRPHLPHQPLGRPILSAGLRNTRTHRWTKGTGLHMAFLKNLVRPALVILIRLRRSHLPR